MVQTQSLDTIKIKIYLITIRTKNINNANSMKKLYLFLMQFKQSKRLIIPCSMYNSILIIFIAGKFLSIVDAAIGKTNIILMRCWSEKL
jgi:hypothetical protein